MGFAMANGPHFEGGQLEILIYKSFDCILSFRTSGGLWLARDLFFTGKLLLDTFSGGKEH